MSSATERTAARRQRADARRSVAAILDAGLACLAADPDASINEIAAAAGVGRMTLYGHFKTRADLVQAVLARAVADADQLLERTDTTGDPVQAVERLARASWRIVSQQRNILTAAQRELPPGRIRTTHDRVMRRVETLLDRGRRNGAFRTDVPKRWLVTIAYTLMHAAAEEVSAGRLRPQDAERLLVLTIHAALQPPAPTRRTPPARRHEKPGP